MGAALVTRWALGLLVTTSGILLDRQGPRALRERIRAGVEADGESEVADLHLWCIGPGLYALILTVVARGPATADDYRARLPERSGLAHVSIEIRRLPGSAS